eukprot:1194286-Prorocentrum_minimum.AAC.1
MEYTRSAGQSREERGNTLGARVNRARGRGEVSVKSVDAREPQNPTESEEYQRHPQGFPRASSVCNVLVPWTPSTPPLDAL